MKTHHFFTPHLQLAQHCRVRQHRHQCMLTGDSTRWLDRFAAARLALPITLPPLFAAFGLPTATACLLFACSLPVAIRGRICTARGGFASAHLVRGFCQLGPNMSNQYSFTKLVLASPPACIAPRSAIVHLSPPSIQPVRELIITNFNLFIQISSKNSSKNRMLNKLRLASPCTCCYSCPNTWS